MTETNLKYYFSKIAIILTSILMLIIVVLIFFMTYLFYLADLKIGIGVCGCVFILFSTTFPNFIRRLKFFFEDTPALIFTKDELIDNINLQKIKWIDIESISSKSVQVKSRVNYIAISLVNPEIYYNSIKNPYLRFIARLNQKYFGGAFSIQLNIIKCENKELFKNLIYKLEEYKNIH